MKLRRRDPTLWTNWSGTVQCHPSRCARPVTIDQIQSEVVRASEEGERLRLIGSGLSFSPLCWTDDNQMSLDRFTGIEAYDTQRRRVWVRAGTRLNRLTEALSERGLALENAPDYDLMSIGGAIATASHGSGAAFGNLATLVTRLRLVCSDGSIKELSADEDSDQFQAAVVSLGALGVVTHVELQCVDDYRLDVGLESATLGEALLRIDEMRRDHRNAGFYWYPYSDSVLLRTAEVTQHYPTRLSPARRALRRQLDWAVRNRLLSAARRQPNKAERFGHVMTKIVSGRHEVLSAREAYPIRRRNRYQLMEYALPLEAAEDALRALDRLIRALQFRIHFPIEIRFVRADGFWLSPQYARDSICIGVPAYPQTAFVDHFSPIAEIFERHDGRPHWGTVHGLGAEELRALYPRFEDFRALRRECDPRGQFLNPHLCRMFDEVLR